MNGNKKRKKYFPNKWSQFKQVPAQFFEPHLFTDLMDWKVRGWMLPEDVYCIIRATNLDTYKIKEHVYKSPKSAETRIQKYCIAQTHSLAITYHDEQQYIGPIDLYEIFGDDEGDSWTTLWKTLYGIKQSPA